MIPNIYYDPSFFGLEILGDATEPNLDYMFNMFVVWKRIDDGQLFCASSSGCSCPSPFEEYPSVESLSACADLAEVGREAYEWAGENAARLIEAKQLIAALRSEDCHDRFTCSGSYHDDKGDRA